MITGIITFLVIFAVIGSILYGQRLAKTEKSDAVFGNPESCLLYTSPSPRDRG